ncbi:hypothetical protein M8818_004706 [Zalaria obscura]|uniref:Uncharacterized protein n=1 Tax=Zalaria obscura TaxID=2024903 RepID=A0ACC3SDN1_9PEZI
MYRFGAAAFLIAIIIPLLQGIPWLSDSTPAVGVEGGVIRREPELVVEDATDVKVRRDNSPTDVCVRWAQQSALVNGTLYLYGGEASTEVGQTDNTWSRSKLREVLSASVLTAPTTSSGNNSAADDQPVQNAAEGAGISVPSLGRGFYFGGHQDAYTTPGWVSWIWRIYLTSLLEFTFPGYTNDQVYTLEGGKTAGTDGNWRNITQGGTQSEAGFPERADGLLAYVPGFGDDGILIGLAGGTNTTYQQMNIIDVYDIATNTATSRQPDRIQRHVDPDHAILHLD